MKAAFIIGTLEVDALAKEEALTNSTVDLLDRICKANDLQGEIIFVSQDPHDAGKAKPKIGMAKIKEERPRVLQEISESKCDMVMCLGPVATACVFNKGNLTESDTLRRRHTPLGEGQPPVFVTFGLENVRWKAGLARWLEMDVAAAVQGHTETEWGTYEILCPNMDEWDQKPVELSWPPHFQNKYGNQTIGFDLETYPGLDPWHPDARIRMAVISDRVGRSWVVQATSDSKLPTWVVDLAADPRVRKAGSNIKYDYKWMRRFGYTINNMWDTSTHEHIIDESNPKKDLKSLSFRYVPKLGDYSRGQRDRVRELGGWEYCTDAEMYQYAGGDGEASIGAYQGQVPIIQRMGLERPARLFRDLYVVLAEMEHVGVHIDKDVNRQLDTLYQEKLAGLRQEIVQVLGPININSNPQLAEALTREVPGISLAVWKKVLGDDEELEVSTKREILERESDKHPIISKVLEYRSYRTRHSTFIKGVYEKHGVRKHGGFYIHPSFNTSVVETYRLSSSSPNGQNFPRKDNDDPDLTVKKQFTSRYEDGCILEGDQSQIEIRIAAWLSGDRKMLVAIESGEDIHTAMAAIMLEKDAAEVTEEERQTCKTRTFLILYGGGAKKLAGDLKISYRKAQQLINEYFETFYELKLFIDKTHAEVRRDLEVETPFGFRRRFSKPDHWKSSHGWMIQRQSFNTIVQNAAACVLYCSMIWLHRHFNALGLMSKLILPVHDSIVVDVYPGELEQVTKLVQWSMNHANEITKQYGVDLDVPLQCDISVGPSWGDVKPLEE